MSSRANSSLKLVIICGLLAMLLPLSIDMYLPALPKIARDFGVEAGRVQMTLNMYVIGFAAGQLFCGPLADSYGRKSVIAISTFLFALMTAACALSQSIDSLIYMRLLHGLSASAGSVVINALMRDCYSAEEFSRMVSFVTLVTIIAPLVAPVAGGWVLMFWSWHGIFWIISIMAVVIGLLIVTQIKETLPKEKRQPFNVRVTFNNFYLLIQNKSVFSYMLVTGFSFAGMFAFLNAGPFVYIELNHVSPQTFGYYFSLNIVFLLVMTLINSRAVRRFGPLVMFRCGLLIQFVVGAWLLIVSIFNLDFMALVLGVAVYIGCVSMVSSNAMAMILADFPYIAGTTASLAGTLRFGIGSLVGTLLSMVNFRSAWPMVSAIFLCATASLLLSLYTYAIQSGRVIR